MADRLPGAPQGPSSSGRGASPRRAAGRSRSRSPKGERSSSRRMDDDRDYRPRDDRDRGRDSYRRDDRDRSRGHYSDDRDKRIGGSKERGQPPRGRSRSPSPRPPSSSRRRSASASRSRSRDLEGSRPRERRQRTPSPVRLSKEEEELLQLTRDARTVFVGQLVVRAGERDIRKYFEQVGPVSEVQLIKDKSSGRSKGIGYVEFEDLEAVPRALLLNGQKLCMKHPACGCSGFPLLVKPSEAEKNYAAMAEAAGGTTSAQMLERRAYAGNLGPQVTEGDLKALASLIAAPDKVMIVRDHRGASRGYAYMQFPDAGSAQRAAASLHGTELGGKAIKVGRLNNLGEVKCPDGTQFLLELGHTRGGHGGGGAAINAQARAALMQQLSSATTAAVHSLGSSLLAQQAVAAATASAAGDAALLPPAPPAGGLDIAAAAAVALGLAPPLPPAPLPRVVAPVGAPSPFFAITNAYSPEEVQDEDEGWQEGLEDALAVELRRHGKIGDLFVDASPAGTARGEVVAHIPDVTGAIMAATALAGRVWGGRELGVTYLTEAEFRARAQ